MVDEVDMVVDLTNSNNRQGVYKGTNLYCGHKGRDVRDEGLRRGKKEGKENLCGAPNIYREETIMADLDILARLKSKLYEP